MGLILPESSTGFGGKQAQAEACRIALVNHCAKNQVSSQHIGWICRHNPVDRTSNFPETLMIVNIRAVGQGAFVRICKAEFDACK